MSHLQPTPIALAICRLIQRHPGCMACVTCITFITCMACISYVVFDCVCSINLLCQNVLNLHLLYTLHRVYVNGSCWLVHTKNPKRKC